MKRRIFTLLLICMVMGLACGCHKKKEESTDLTEGTILLYYLNQEENGLVKIPKEMELSDQTVTAVRQILDQLSQSDMDGDVVYHTVLDEQIGGWNVSSVENDGVTIDFGDGYRLMNNSREVLVRAAVVKTLVQMEQISKVSFTVNEEPLVNVDGVPVGVMRDTTFVMDNDKKEVYDYQETVRLSLANEKGDGLVEVRAELSVTDNQSMERGVLEALRRSNYDKAKNPLPPDLVFNKVYVLQNICYVDVNENIYDGVAGVEEEIKIYAMVNTLTSLSRISQVQFTVNGQVVSEINEVAGLDQPLSYDYAYTMDFIDDEEVEVEVDEFE